MGLHSGSESWYLVLNLKYLWLAQGDEPNAKSAGKPAGANTDGFDVAGSDVSILKRLVGLALNVSCMI